MKRTTARAVVLAWLLLAAARGSLAQPPVPVGSDFQVNLFTSANQVWSAGVADADGDFIIVWSSFQGIATASTFGQRFSSGGGRLGGEFQVNASTATTNLKPRPARGAGGGFIVVWSAAPSQDGNSYGVFARRLGSTGLPLGTEFQVNTYTTGSQILARIASDTDGDFVVVWYGAGNGDLVGVFGRRFNSAGTPLATEFRANSVTTGDQDYPAVAMEDNGDFVVVWASPQDGSGKGVFGQRFTSSGSPTGPEFQVNVHITGDQDFPDIGLDADGDFVVAWNDATQDADGTGIFARRYDSTGTPLGIDFRVNATITGAQNSAAIATDRDGDFVIAWQDPGGGDANVWVRRFKATSIPTGGDLLANSFTPLTQAIAAIASDADGDFVVTWSSQLQDGSQYGVFAQRFDVPATVDVDGDGAYLPLTDGLLLLRFAFGFTGATLITGAVGGGCTRCDAPSITAYLESLL
jgi:hypothetical protein